MELSGIRLHVDGFHQRAMQMLTWLKLPALARQVKRQHLTYLSEDQLLSLRDAARQVKRRGVPGDFVEYGIALGGSAVYLASQIDGQRRFQGFDVFAMIPPPGKHDDKRSRVRYEIIRSGRSEGLGGGIYYGYQDDLWEKVCKTFEALGHPVDGTRILLHRGLFEDTVRFGPRDQVALAHIDCDWHDPVKLCLERTAANLSPGGLMILDDYNAYGGCRKATDQFLAAHEGFHLVQTEPHAIIRKSA